MHMLLTGWMQGCLYIIQHIQCLCGGVLVFPLVLQLIAPIRKHLAIAYQGTGSDKLACTLVGPGIATPLLHYIIHVDIHSELSK